MTINLNKSKFARLKKRAKYLIYNRPYLTAFIIGSIYYLYVMSWIFGVRTAELARGSLAIKLTSLSAGFITIFCFALSFVIFVWVYKKLHLNISSPGVLILAPAIWVVTEYFRAVFFSIVSIGPGGRIGPYWVFGNIGYWLVRTPFAYCSRFGGIYLLCGIMALFIASIAHSYMVKNLLPIVLIMVVTSTLSFMGWILYKTPNGQVRTVSSLHLAVSLDEEEDSVAVNKLLLELPKKSQDVIVLPEYSHFWDINQKSATDAIAAPLRKKDGLIIDSVRKKQTNNTFNMISYHNAEGKVLFEQPKWFIIPGGEFIPYVYQVLLAYSGQTRLIMSFREQKNVDTANRPEVPFSFEGVRYGGLACSGAIAPELYRRMTMRGGEVLTNSASLITLGVSRQYHNEAKDMAQLQAIANARPFIQSARSGYSYIIDQNGKFLKIDQNKQNSILSAQVQSNSKKTVYTYIGDLNVGVSLAVLISYSIVLKKRI